jgi:hypothetical protein
MQKMLTLTSIEKYDNPVIQDNWRAGRIPHFSGIVIGDGRMIVMGEQIFLHNGTHECHIYPIVESVISSFIEFSGEFIETAVMKSRTYIPEFGGQVVCGEGEMGNEGFVALVNADILIWSAFFTVSNPFYEVKRSGDSIIAKSTHDVLWEFPISAPWNARVLGAEPKASSH